MLTCRHALDCRLKIKLSGSSGSGQANGQGSSSGRGSKGGGEHDRWMADCADCGEEGDLLCCEVCPLTLLLLGSCLLCMSEREFKRGGCGYIVQNQAINM